MLSDSPIFQIHCNTNTLIIIEKYDIELSTLSKLDFVFIENFNSNCFQSVLLHIA